MDAAVSVTDMEILLGRQAWVRNSLETLGSAGMGHRVLSTDGLGSDSSKEMDNEKKASGTQRLVE